MRLGIFMLYQTCLSFYWKERIKPISYSIHRLTPKSNYTLSTYGLLLITSPTTPSYPSSPTPGSSSLGRKCPSLFLFVLAFFPTTTLPCRIVASSAQPAPSLSPLPSYSALPSASSARSFGRNCVGGYFFPRPPDIPEAKLPGRRSSVSPSGC